MTGKETEAQGCQEVRGHLGHIEPVGPWGRGEVVEGRETAPGRSPPQVGTVLPSGSVVRAEGMSCSSWLQTLGGPHGLYHLQAEPQAGEASWYHSVVGLEEREGGRGGEGGGGLGPRRHVGPKMRKRLDGVHRV